MDMEEINEIKIRETTETFAKLERYILPKNLKIRISNVNSTLNTNGSTFGVCIVFK